MYDSLEVSFERQMFELPGIKNVNPIFQHFYLPHPSKPKAGPPSCTQKQRISKAFRYGPQARNEPFLSPFSLSTHTHAHTITNTHISKGFTCNLAGQGPADALCR